MDTFKNIKEEDRNKIINDNMAFIINSISKVTKRYVSIENDEEFSVGVIAFNEAIDRYNEDKGPFLPYANLVISSRLISYLKSENKHKENYSIQRLEEEGIEIEEIFSSSIENKYSLKEEIESLTDEIQKFGFGFEDLVDESPKHKDTRDKAINISEQISKDDILKGIMYLKKRLPIKKVAIRYSVTEKIIKGSKKFIITVVIIIDKNFTNLRSWIRK